MRTFLQAVRLLSIVVWVGGIIFFAFVLAPTAFHVLPAHEAGLVVGGTLPVLDRIGFVCGILFLWTNNRVRGNWHPKGQPHVLLVILMLALTLYVDKSILPRMERDRASVGGDITLAPPGNPARADFDRLHPLSERLEGTVLLAGLAVVVLLAAERERARDTIAS